MAENDLSIYQKYGFLNRTTLLLGEEAMEILEKTTVAIGGCGGVGAGPALTLARMGVGGFQLADPGIFDPPDMNRQWHATRSTLGRNKAVVCAEMIRDINPDARIQIFEEGVSPENLDTFLEPADVYVDGLDIVVPLDFRIAVYQAAQKACRYSISTPILGAATVAFAAVPGGMGLDVPIAKFIDEARQDGQLPAGIAKHLCPDFAGQINRHIKHAVPSIGLAPALAASVSATEILCALLGEQKPEWREPLALPKILVVDLMQGQIKSIDYKDAFKATD